MGGGGGCGGFGGWKYIPKEKTFITCRGGLTTHGAPGQ
ncbi:unnamed protein product [Staurois parvus]|uniref:Uncharacterized protein n=1 Tax=Staurois parvus TaxID=386267 RepID=A0ABN9G5Z1_9NEOB|nr:unnamed protein product [Staurois parvus]